MRLGAIVTAGALTFSLAACGGEDDKVAKTTTTTTSTTPSADAGASTGAATSADGAAASTGAATGGEVAAGEEVPIADFMTMVKSPGEDKLSTYTMKMVMDADGEQMDMAGKVDMASGTPKMDMTMTVPDMGEMQLLLVDGRVFMAMPGLTPEGMYMEAPEDVTGDISQLEELDMSSQWDAWEKGAEKVVFKGNEDVDGTEMRHYEVTVSQEAVDQAMQTASEQLGDDAAATSLGLDGPLVYDVFLDDENFMRKMKMNIGGIDMDVTMDDWGTPQDIKAPAKDKIMDMGDMGTGPTG